MLKIKLRKLIYYFISSIIFIAAFQEPMEMVFIQFVKNTFSELSNKDGILDIQLYRNYPSYARKSKMIFTLYKSETSQIVEIRKDFTENDEWMSNDPQMKIYYNNKNKYFTGIGHLQDNKILGLLSNSSSLSSINRIINREDKPLILLTKHEYYFRNLKNIAGVSLAIGASIFILITGYYNNKKIQSDDASKKKSIILINTND